MIPFRLVAAAACLLGTAVLGVLAHELSHAVVLRLGGVGCRLSLLPGREAARGYMAGLRGPLARVTPTTMPEGLPPWRLRAAAMAPLTLALPFGLVLVGTVPDPFAGGAPSVQAAALAWLGCSLPSPRDFSLLFYPEAAMASERPAASIDD